MSKPVLYIVSTPIGNLQDITLRALEVLKTVDIILCEDTRHTGKLLQFYGITKPMANYHEHNEHHKLNEILSDFTKNQSVALVSDAGTPLLSDPGLPLIRACINKGITIIPIPGASSILAALVASGLPTDRFYFEGFLPTKSIARQNRIKQLLNLDATIICFESPYRIIKVVEELTTLAPTRIITIARELTKLHEQLYRGTPSEVLIALQNSTIRGELVLLIAKEDYII